MKVPNRTQCVQAVFFISILSLSLVAVGAFDEVYAALSTYSSTKTLAAGDNLIVFRDSSNTANNTALVTLDTSTSGEGFVTIQVIEDDSNLNATTIDSTFVNITSTTQPKGLKVGGVEVLAQLDETGADTGVFEGTVDLSKGSVPGKLKVSESDELNTIYSPKTAASRLSATLSGVAGTIGDAEIFDWRVETSTEQAAICGFDLVTHPVQIQFPALTTATEITVTISYANAFLNAPLTTYDPETDLKLLYRTGSSDPPIGISAFLPFKLTTTVFSPITVDTDARTITATLVKDALFPALQGQYALGATIAGCAGGGGGGLVRPGLVVNALAGVGAISSFFSSSDGGATGGGSGYGPAQPVLLSSSFTSQVDGAEGFGGIISDGEEEFTGTPSDDDDKNSLDTTQVVNKGEKLTFTFDLYENQGINNLEHVAFYMNIRGDETAEDSDTYIIFEKGQPAYITDPHGLFADATFELSQKDAWNLVLKFDMTFAKAMDTSHVILKIWDLDKNSSEKKYLDAFQVLDPSAVISEEEFKPTTADQGEFESSISEVAQSDSVKIPIWVKNNANWWAERQIDDADFVAGIEYLIKHEIINVPETQVVAETTSQEIPSWIRNNAEWWASDQITEDEFVQAIQWLITAGVMRV